MSDDRSGPPADTAEDFEARLAAALEDKRNRKWVEDNWEAIQRWNEWVATNGLTMEEYLDRIERRNAD